MNYESKPSVIYLIFKFILVILYIRPLPEQDIHFCAAQCPHHQHSQCTLLWNNLLSRKKLGKFGAIWLSLLRKHQK